MTVIARITGGLMLAYSAMRSPTLHCSIMSSLALGLSVALMIASTSWASKYSGSFLGRAELADLLGCVPRGRRLRATACVVMFPLPALQEDPRMTLADRDFLVQFNEGVQLWGIGSDARNAGIFLHMKLSRGLSD